MESRQDEIKKLGELMKHFRVAMLTNVNDEGRLHSRPMGVMDVEFDGDIWFFTQEHSPKVGEMRRDWDVNVSFCDEGKQRYISVAGKAMLIDDREKMKELWTPMLKAWFKDGLDDPELALLKINVESAEYWDGPNSKIVQLFGMVAAAVTGKEFDHADHNKVSLT